jgi:agmatinase
MTPPARFVPPKSAIFPGIGPCTAVAPPCPGIAGAPASAGAADARICGRAAVFGVPFDGTVYFRRGARFAPDAIREVSDSLEDYSPRLDRELTPKVLTDCGNLLVDAAGGEGDAAGGEGDAAGGEGDAVTAYEGDAGVTAYLAAVEAAVAPIFAQDRLPVALGGEHLITLPLVRAACRRHPGLAVVSFDAHTDLREELDGRHLSHATVMRRVAETLGPANVFLFGVRSGTREEFAWARSKLGAFNTVPTLAALTGALPALWGRPVYVTVDIDVLDPAFAPGTGSAEPGGCSPDALFEAIYALADAHRLGRLRVVGFDLVEVNPSLDPTGRTAILAAKLVREAVLGLA